MNSRETLTRFDRRLARDGEWLGPEPEKAVVKESVREPSYRPRGFALRSRPSA
jgi:hypothetical protein